MRAKKQSPKNKKVETMSTHTKESLKEKATIIRKFLKETCDADISHSHSLELISKIFDFKDWNTASAMSESKPKVKQNSLPIQIETAGDKKKTLEESADTEFDKEKFLSDIHSIPHWVKNGDDLLTFCKHIQYRLFQYQNTVWWYRTNTHLNDEKITEVNNLMDQYDKAYQNDTSKFLPFSELFE